MHETSIPRRRVLGRLGLALVAINAPLLAVSAWLAAPTASRAIEGVLLFCGIG